MQSGCIDVVPLCKREWFDVPNQELYEELGLSRLVKYRTLQHLEEGKVIALERAGKRTLRVRIL